LVVEEDSSDNKDPSGYAKAVAAFDSSYCSDKALDADSIPIDKYGH